MAATVQTSSLYIIYSIQKPVQSAVCFIYCFRHIYLLHTTGIKYSRNFFTVNMGKGKKEKQTISLQIKQKILIYRLPSYRLHLHSHTFARYSKSASPPLHSLDADHICHPYIAQALDQRTKQQYKLPIISRMAAFDKHLLT